MVARGVGGCHGRGQRGHRFDGHLLLEAARHRASPVGPAAREASEDWRTLPVRRGGCQADSRNAPPRERDNPQDRPATTAETAKLAAARSPANGRTESDAVDLGVLFGLGSAAAFGAGDFSGGLASRRVSGLTVAGLAQAIGLVALLVLLAVLRPSPPGAGAIAVAAVAGACGGVGLVALYFGLSLGQHGRCHRPVGRWLGRLATAARLPAWTRARLAGAMAGGRGHHGRGQRRQWRHAAGRPAASRGAGRRGRRSSSASGSCCSTSLPRSQDPRPGRWSPAAGRPPPDRRVRR